MRCLLALTLLACSSQSPTSPGTAPSPSEPAPPAPIVLAADPGLVSTGYMHQCCVTGEDTVVCNGSNAHGEISVPDRKLIAVGAGLYTTCAIDLEGRALCWGEMAPDVAVGADQRFVRIAAGQGFGCALDRGGAMHCWTTGDFGPVPSGQFHDLVAGWDHVCGLRPTGEVVCAGRPSEREPIACADLEGAEAARCGPEQMVPRSWTAPPADLRAVLLGGGANHNCAQTVAGAVVCWGALGHGDGNTIWSNHLFPPEDLGPDLRQLSGGGGVSCALDARGKARCWGHQGDLPGTFVDIDSGSSGTCGIRESGDLECFTYSSFAGAAMDDTPLRCRADALPSSGAAATP